MKKTILILAISSLLIGIGLIGCETSQTKVNNAKENVVEAKQELKQAIKDSLIDFKLKYEVKIAEHDQKIADLKVEIAKQKVDDRNMYNTELTKLELKNNEMKKKLKEFNNENKENWDSFKNEFSRDMNDLGEAFNNFFSKK